MKKNHTLHWAWIVLSVCFINMFINYSIRLGFGVVLPEMIRTLDFGRAAGGTIFNSYFFAYITITPFAGFLTDRLGARWVITVCLLILGVGVFMMGTVKTLWSACLFFGVAGLGAAGLWAPVITLVQRWFAFHRRGLALGILATGYGLGLATMGAVFPLIVDRFSWHYAWFFLGGMALFMVAPNGVFLRSDPQSAGCLPWGQKTAAEDQHDEMETPKTRIALATVFKNRLFWRIGFSYFAIAYSLYAITTFMVDYAQYQLGMPLEKASMLATIHGLGQIVGVLTVLPLSDYLGRKKTIMISNAFITAALAGVLIAGDSWTLLCISVGIVAIFYGVTFPIYGACAGDYFPKEAMGTVIGAWTPFYGFGAILTHWVTGVLRDSTGSYTHSFAISVVMAALGLFLMSQVKKMTD